MQTTWKSRVLAGLKIALAAAFVALAARLLRGQDLGLLARRPLWCAAAAAVVLQGQVFCAWRLKILLEGSGFPLPFGKVFRLVGLSFFAGSVLPGVAGQDAVKLAGFRFLDRSAGWGKVLVVLMADRMVGLFAVLFYACALSFFVPVPDGIAGPLVKAARWPFPAAAAAVMIGTMLLRGGDAAVRRLPARFQGPASWAADFLASPRGVKKLVQAFSISLLSIGLGLLTQGAIGVSLHSALAGPSPLVLHVFLATASMVATALPIAPAGLGVGQAALSQLYPRFGLAAAAGLLTVTVMQVSQLFVAVVLGAMGSWRLLAPPMEAREK